MSQFTNALDIKFHPSLFTSEGIVAQGSDYYKASINGVALGGVFKPLDNGLSVNINAEKIEQMINGRVRVRVDQNRTATLTLDCVYMISTAGRPSTGAKIDEMKSAMGIGSDNFKWDLKQGDRWKFWIDDESSDRGQFDLKGVQGAVSGTSIPAFLGKELVLESGATMSVPANGFWQLSLPFMYYLDSDVLDADPISPLTGELKPAPSSAGG